MRSILTVLLLTSLVLAGCADEAEPPESGPTSAQCLEQGLILDTASGQCVAAPFVIEDFEDPNHHCVVTQQEDRVHAPDLVGNPWTLGQSWTYRLVVDGNDKGTTQLVYYDDQDVADGVPMHYMVGTPTRDQALSHAIFGENPMIGRVHRILYSPHESGNHADMFHFPLCAGSTWTTVFYGETFTLTASPATIDLPQGSDGGFLIEGSSDSGSTLRLSYSPAAQWFTFIDLDRADGGTVDLSLESMDQGYTGQAFFLRGQKDDLRVLFADKPVPNLAPVVATETISREDGGDGPYDTIGLHIVWGMTGTGVATFTITGPDGTEAWRGQMSPQDAGFVEDLLEVPYQAGDWNLELQGVSVDPEAASVFAHATMVSIYDRSGSVS